MAGRPSPAATRAVHVPQLDTLIAASATAWDGALAHGEKHGYRNSQVTVLAPTGTIGFMMDCDTTGVEPDLALVKYKKLVGGGMIKIVNTTVPSALIKLGYNEAQVNAIVSYIDATGTIEGAPGIKPEHLPVFDCSFKASKGTRIDSLHGPHQDDGGDAAVPVGGDFEDGESAAGLLRWTILPRPTSRPGGRGSKAVAIYRDNSKGTQPLNVNRAETDARQEGHARLSPRRCRLRRRRLATTPGDVSGGRAALAAAASASATAAAQAQIANATNCRFGTWLRRRRRTPMRGSRMLRRGLCGIACRRSALR